MNKNDFISGIILFCIASFFAIESIRMPVFDEFYTAPGLFPLIIAVILAVLSLRLVVRSLISGRLAVQPASDTESRETDPGLKRQALIRTLVIVIAMTIYVILLSFNWPYLFITTLFLIAMLYYYHPGNKIKNLIISVAVALSMDFLFGKVFFIPLP